MPSGKQARRSRQARTPPPTRSTARRQASPRVLIGIAIALVLIAAGIGAAIALTSGGGSSHANTPARGSLANALPGARETQQLLQGIPQHGNVLGSPSAPVTMVEYIDLQCPFCQQFETQAMPTLVKRYVRTGKVKVEARPIAFIGPDSQRGRTAALAAGEQNRFFNFTQLLYLNQGTENTGWLDDSMVEAAAASIPGLRVRDVVDARSSGAVKAAANRYDRLASDSHVNSTPTILVGRNAAGAKRVALASPTDLKTLERAIDRALRRKA